jgi:hypothetical protein
VEVILDFEWFIQNYFFTTAKGRISTYEKRVSVENILPVLAVTV